MKRFPYLRMMFIFGLFYLAFPQAAHAYLDPGTGSYVLQMILAALAGVAFVIKVYWTKIKAFFGSRLHKTSHEGQDEDEE